MDDASKINIDVLVDGQKRRVNGQERMAFADQYGLSKLIAGRYSEILVVDLMMNLEINGVDPSSVIHEIERLESKRDGYTKAATQFKHAPLHPLWHQHYFSPHYIAENIQNELKKGFAKIWDASMGPKGSIIEEKHVSALAYNITDGTIETRSDEGRITGEWLIFAMQPAGNIYLCMATHRAGDKEIYKKIAYCCERQFPLLEPFVSDRNRKT